MTSREIRKALRRMWTRQIVKLADQTVTNSDTLVDDSTLQFAMLTGDVWQVELTVIYSANDATGDAKIGLAFPSSTGVVRHMGSHDASDAAFDDPSIQVAAATSTTAVAVGGDASNTPRVLTIEAILRPTADGTFKVQFAENAATATKTATIRRGSILRAKKLA